MDVHGLDAYTILLSSLAENSTSDAFPENVTVYETERGFAR